MSIKNLKYKFTIFHITNFLRTFVHQPNSIFQSRARNIINILLFYHINNPHHIFYRLSMYKLLYHACYYQTINLHTFFHLAMYMFHIRLFYYLPNFLHISISLAIYIYLLLTKLFIFYI